jgi:hypothetical protein
MDTMTLSMVVCFQVRNLDVAKRCLETYFLEVRRCGIEEGSLIVENLHIYVLARRWLDGV